ncbi:hypothetical protein BSNK01_28370 [Bacillaceae bacterium]
MRPYTRLFDIVDTITWRKRNEEYQTWARAALIASTIINVNSKKGKKVKIEQIIGKPPEKKKAKKAQSAVKRHDFQDLIEVAKMKGVKLPNGC